MVIYNCSKREKEKKLLENLKKLLTSLIINVIIKYKLKKGVNKYVGIICRILG